MRNTKQQEPGHAYAEAFDAFFPRTFFGGAAFFSF
jgi:hypothetical protein